MKKLSFLFCSALLSLSALACPNIAGSYSCTESGNFGTESYSMDIAQSGNVFTTSTDGGASEQIVADGVARQFSDVGVTGSVTVSCTSDAVVINVLANVTDQSGAVVSVNQTSNMSKSGANLIISGSTTAYGQTFTSSTTCTPN